METFDVSINNPDGIAISFPAVETVCYGETNIPVDFSWLSVSGGNPPYSYEWFDENNLSLGIFSPSSTVSGKLFNYYNWFRKLCFSSSYFTISEPEQINVDFDLEDINCFGETATETLQLMVLPEVTLYFLMMLKKQQLLDYLI